VPLQGPLDQTRSPHNAPRDGERTPWAWRTGGKEAVDETDYARALRPRAHRGERRCDVGVGGDEELPQVSLLPMSGGPEPSGVT
jgi:hypothetical protein